jgi:hypothetical protein
VAPCIPLDLSKLVLNLNDLFYFKTMRKILIHRIWDMYCEYWRSNGILYEDSSSVLLLQGLLMMMMFSCQRETYDWTCFGGYELSLIIIIFHLVIGELEPEHRKFEKF